MKNIHTMPALLAFAIAASAQAQADLILTNGKIATMAKKANSCRPSPSRTARCWRPAAMRRS
jgi:hypothetical protein